MLARSISYLVIGSVISTVFSIAVSSILFGMAVVAWAVRAVRDRQLYLSAPPLTPALLAFLVAVLLSIVFSEDPATSVPYLSRMLRLLPVFWIYSFLSRNQIRWTLLSVILLLGASASLGIVQYFWLIDVTLLNRIRGFMSHWMTFSGQLMIGSVCLAVILVCGRSILPGFDPMKSAWTRFWKVAPWLLVWLLILAALLLTFTRSAWIGAFVGTVCLSWRVNRRWLIPLIGAMALLWILLPREFSERFLAGLDPNDATNQGRVELVVTGLRMIRDHPLTGVGPRLVPILAPQYADRYRESENFPEWLYQHLHNSPLQIAAELGLIGLTAWLWLWVRAIRDLFRFARASESSQSLVAVIGLCAIAAFLTAGLFEYNFGDSEILSLLLFLVTAPYVFSKDYRPGT